MTPFLSEVETGLWVAYGENRTTENRNKLVEHYYTDMKKIAVSVWKRSYDKRNGYDDWLAECVIVLVSAVEKFDLTVGNPFGNYLRVAIQRRFYGQGRMKSLSQFAEDFDVVSDETPPEFTADFWEKAKKHVGSNIIEMRFVEGLSWQEIGEKLGISHTAVYNKFQVFARIERKHANA